MDEPAGRETELVVAAARPVRPTGVPAEPRRVRVRPGVPDEAVGS